MVFELGEPELVNEEGLVSCMEEGECHKDPDGERGLVVVHEETAEEEAVGQSVLVQRGERKVKGTDERSLVQHHQAADEIGKTRVRDGDRDEEDDRGRREVKENENEDELPELHNVWNEPDEAVDDGAEKDRGDDTERKDVEENLGEEVGNRRVVSVGPLAHKEKPLVGKEAERGERGESEKGKDEEKQAEPVSGVGRSVDASLQGNREH